MLILFKICLYNRRLVKDVTLTARPPNFFGEDNIPMPKTEAYKQLTYPVFKRKLILYHDWCFIEVVSKL